MAELQQVRTWAQELISTHLDPRFGTGSWTFSFDRAKRRAGLCNFTDRNISVSRYLAAKFSDQEIQQVLLHEIAHALAGSTAGHGAIWKRISADIGYKGTRTYSGEIAHEHARWIGLCPQGHEHFRFRRPSRPSSCSKCSSSYSPMYRITWHAQTSGS